MPCDCATECCWVLDTRLRLLMYGVSNELFSSDFLVYLFEHLFSFLVSHDFCVFKFFVGEWAFECGCSTGRRETMLFILFSPPLERGVL